MRCGASDHIGYGCLWYRPNSIRNGCVSRNCASSRHTAKRVVHSVWAASGHDDSTRKDIMDMWLLSGLQPAFLVALGLIRDPCDDFLPAAHDVMSGGSEAASRHTLCEQFYASCRCGRAQAVVGPTCVVVLRVLTRRHVFSGGRHRHSLIRSRPSCPNASTRYASTYKGYAHHACTAGRGGGERLTSASQVVG